MLVKEIGNNEFIDKEKEIYLNSYKEFL